MELHSTFASHTRFTQSTCGGKTLAYRMLRGLLTQRTGYQSVNERMRASPAGAAGLPVGA